MTWLLNVSLKCDAPRMSPAQWCSNISQVVGTIKNLNNYNCLYAKYKYTPNACNRPAFSLIGDHLPGTC